MMLSKLLFGLGLLGFGHATAASSTTYPTPVECIGPACSNPVVNVNGVRTNLLHYQDFSVIQREDGSSEGMFYRYSKSNDTGLGLSVAIAPSLHGPWEYAFEVLAGPLKSKTCTNRSNTNVWAPEIHFVNGTYYLYYSVNCPPFEFDLCVATSATMEQNSWVDHGSMNVPTAKSQIPNQIPHQPTVSAIPQYVRLDGSLLASDSQPKGAATPHYMIFGSYQFGLYGFPVSNDLLTIAPGGAVEPIIIDQLTQGPDVGFANGDVAPNATENANLLAHGNYVYLFYARGDCCPPASLTDSEVYQIQVCRTAVNTFPRGPWLDRAGANCETGGIYRNGTTVLYSHGKQPATRHSCVVTDNPKATGRYLPRAVLASSIVRGKGWSCITNTKTTALPFNPQDLVLVTTGCTGITRIGHILLKDSSVASYRWHARTNG